jgi:hypothetical protein
MCLRLRSAISMQPNTEHQPNETPKPAPVAPVMDVKPVRAPPVVPQPATPRPINSELAKPPEANPDTPHKILNLPKQAPGPKAVKSGSGLGTVVFLVVIIVLVLAAIAVYAYTKRSST